MPFLGLSRRLMMSEVKGAPRVFCGVPFEDKVKQTSYFFLGSSAGLR